jgi:hypothetical protein
MDAVRTENLGRPDRQLCDRIFWKFRWKSFLFKICVQTVRHWRPNSRLSAASNFHIRLSTSGPKGMNVWTAILQHVISITAMRASRPRETDVRTVEVKSAISILVACAFRPRLTEVRTVIFELRFWPYLWASPDGKPHRPDGVSIFPYSKLGKNRKLIDHRWTSGRAAKTEASRHSVGPRRKRYVVQTDDVGWSSVWSEWTCRLDERNSGQMDIRTGWHFVRTADRESEIFYLFRSAESFENTLTSGIPVYNIFYT